MPFPIAETIGAAATIGATGLNFASANKTNLRTRQHNEHMYRWQRQDALDDWNRVNAYNDPSAVMARLKKAGLNPALVYGQGSTGSNADSVRNVQMQGYNPDTPKVDPNSVGSAIKNFAEVKFMKLQESLLQQNLKNEMAKEHLIEAQTADTLGSGQLKGISVERSALDLETFKRLTKEDIPYHKATAEYQSEATKAELLHLDLEEKSKFQALSQEEQRERINEIKQRIKNMGQEYRLKEFEEKLNKDGVKGTDWIYWREIKKFFNLLSGRGSYEKNNLNN